MKNVLFAKIEAWLVVLIVLLGLLGMIVFGALVLEGQKDEGRFAKVGKAALSVAELPRTAQRIFTEGPPARASRYARFHGRGGWTFPEDHDAARMDAFLLLSRHDGNRGRTVVELIDLTDHTVRHSWLPDADALLADVPRDSDVINYSRWNLREYVVVHPYLLPNGDLIIKDHQTPATRIDHCSVPAWQNAETYFHHSTEMGSEGTLWIPSRIVPAPDDHGRSFFIDGLAELTLEGEILREINLPEILERNGMMAMIFTAGVYDNDPLHLNDIEPVLEDGPYWKRGDLFLSMRHRSLVMQYRPSENRVVWYKQGPWLAQHDVEILDDRRIGIFNNNAYDRGQGTYILGNSEISVYDFETGEVTTPYAAAMEELEVITLTEGLFDVSENGSVMVEESNSGRILIFTGDGLPIAEYVNRAEDGEVYAMGWARLISGQEGDAALAAIAGRPSCG